MLRSEPQNVKGVAEYRAAVDKMSREVDAALALDLPTGALTPKQAAVLKVMSGTGDSLEHVMAFVIRQLCEVEPAPAPAPANVVAMPQRPRRASERGPKAEILKFPRRCRGATTTPRAVRGEL